jgi:hypothetical protein
MATVRRRSRIETDLPAEVRESLNRLLLEGATYEEASLWCKSKGYDISRSSVGRYGKAFFEAYQNIKRFEDQSRAIASTVDDGMPMEEAVGKMLLQKVMAALVDGSADITENSRLIADVAKLQSAHVQMAKWKRELETRAQKAAQAVTTMVKKGGLSDEAADAIRAQILGIVKR